MQTQLATPTPPAPRRQGGPRTGPEIRSSLADAGLIAEFSLGAVLDQIELKARDRG